MKRPADAMEDDEVGSERTCVVTRQRQSPDEMIRFVLDPAGVVTPDIRRRLPGRGVWVSASEASVGEAARKGAFARAFKKQVTVPADLPSQVGELLERDLLQALSLANKAGLVAAGAFQVEEALEKGHTAILIHASDGGQDGGRKFRQLWRRFSDDGKEGYCLEFLNSEQIGLALGRPSVVHAALRRGAATAALMARALRLEAYRSEAGNTAKPVSQREE